MRIEECLEKNREESLRRRLEALRDCAFNIQRELDALKSADAQSCKMFVVVNRGHNCVAYPRRKQSEAHLFSIQATEIIEGTFTPKITKG